ncbi:MAG TPA: hypothetical protein VNT52_03230, partial [Acidimicrobiales bacterium]|nr:hypothetical protein [Acidimicrobiales bacterium]
VILDRMEPDDPLGDDERVVRLHAVEDNEGPSAKGRGAGRPWFTTIRSCKSRHFPALATPTGQA